MKPVILVIGIKDMSILESAWLSSDGVKTERQPSLVSVLVGEFEDGNEANKAFQDEASKYDYMEIKTVYKK